MQTHLKLDVFFAVFPRKHELYGARRTQSVLESPRATLNVHDLNRAYTFNEGLKVQFV